MHARPFILLILLAFICPAAAEDGAQAAETAAQTEPASSAPAPDAPAPDAPAPTAPSRVAPDTQQQRHQAVIDHLERLGRGYEIIELVANTEAFSGLYLPESRGRPQGGIVLLHDHGQHGHWPALVAPLREYLPRYGWTTLAIELPEPPAAPLPSASDVVPPTTSKSEPSAEPEQTAVDAPAKEEAPAPANEPLDSNGISVSGTAESDSNNEPGLPPLERLPDLPVAAEESPASTAPETTADERYRQQVRARIEAAVSYLNQRGQYNLVILANGISASWAADFMLAAPPTDETDNNNDEDTPRAREPGHTLVLIDPQQDPYSQIPLSDQLQQLDIAVLDLLTDLRQVHEHEEARRAGAMRRRQRQQYQQIELPARATDEAATSVILRRVRGWLRTHAAGVEVGSNPDRRNAS